MPKVNLNSESRKHAFKHFHLDSAISYFISSKTDIKIPSTAKEDSMYAIKF